jgi:hypothetical protein
VLNPLAVLFSRPNPRAVGLIASLGGPVWHVATNNLETLLATDLLHCTRIWFGRLCSGQGKRLERVGDHEVLVHCNRCDRVIADIEFEAEA